MSPTWPKAVLFDFDGVLVNSEPLHFRAFAEVLAEEGISIDEAEYYREYLGFDDRGSFAKVFASRGRTLDPPTSLRVMTRKGEAMMRQIMNRDFRPLPYVQEFVRGLWRSYPLAICSGALREEIEVMLEGIALRDCFGVITSAEDVTVGKPDPRGYVQTMQRVGEKLGKTLQARDCLVVEDAPPVIRTCRRAGFRVLGVATSHFSDSLKEADWVASNLDPLTVGKLIPQLKFIM